MRGADSTQPTQGHTILRMNETAISPLLAVTGITKRFGRVLALSGVSLAVEAGEVLALAGDNGAGKSTLIKIIAGVFQPDTGEIRYGGQPVRFDNPQQARDAGIETVHQDLALADNLDIGANVFLGREPKKRLFGFPVIDRKAMQADAQKSLSALDIDIPGIDRPVRQLSGGQRQAVAIGRAIHWNAKLLMMDEPVAALALRERRKVIALIETLKAGGTGVIFIAHDLDDLFAVADRIVVLHRGVLSAERKIGDTSRDEIARLIVNG